MKCALFATAVVLLAVTGADGLNCVACRPNRQIGGASFPPALEEVIRRFPRCSQLDAKNPGLDFEMKCDRGLDSCVKIRDERGNEMRSCFPGKTTGCSGKTKKGQVLCKCRGDFCNAAEGSAPALISLFVPLAAALLRLH